MNNLKNWDFVKNYKYSLSTLKVYDNPNQFLYQLIQGVYYPAVYICDVQAMINRE